MNPQGGESNNNQPPSAAPTTVEPNAAASNPLDKLENVVAAAQEAAAAQTTPKTQFENQFGSGPVAPPPAESAPDLMGQALANLKTPSEQTQPVAESPAQPEPEQTPAEKLKQQIADSVDAFLEEVTKEKAAP